jgi:Ni/Fe-hydrogenase subunit HybB-like protein
MIKKGFYTISIIAILIGIWGFYNRLTLGHQDANYGSYVVWGLWVAMYLFFVGIAAGCFVFASFDFLFNIKIFKGIGKIALWTALVSLGAGLLSIWLDLGHMERIWKVFLEGNPKSVMWQLVWGYTIFGIMLLGILWLVIRTPDNRWIKPIMAFGIVLSLFLTGASGALLGVQVARPFWHTGLFPVQIPIYSFASGAAVLLVVIGLFGNLNNLQRPQLLRTLAIISVVLQMTKVYFLWAEMSQALYGGLAPNIEPIQQVLFGQYWWAFWILQLGLGAIIPIIVLVIPQWSQNGYVAALMGVFMLVGFAVTRANIVFPALTVPEIEALRTAFSGPHLSFEYFPSAMEWAVTIGTIGLATLGFLIGKDFLALMETDRSQEVQA